MDKPYTKLMTRPRRCKALAGTQRGWWYTNHDSIDILAEHENGGTTCVSLTRKQLLWALEIMDRA